MNFVAFTAIAATPLITMIETLPAAASFRDKAQQQSAFIQSHFYDSSAGLYRPWSPQKSDANPYDFMWGNGVQLSALLGAIGYDSAKYRPILTDFCKGLRKYWDASAAIPGFDAYWTSPGHSDKYYDDNAWLVIGFAEAYDVTKDKSYLDWAKQTEAQVLSGWDDVLGGGIYWHESRKSKNTCSNAPAATGALCLYRWTKDKSYLDWAIKIRTWTREHLLDTDGLYWDNINLLGEIQRTKWTYNTALMIRTDTLLYEILKDKQYLTDAQVSADAGIKAWVDPETGAIANTARFNHLFSEALLRLYDVTKDTRYLNVVRAHAAYGDRYVRDPKGGYGNTWERGKNTPAAPKEMIENAGAARLLWLLAKYPDSGELMVASVSSAGKGDDAKAESLLRDAVDSDAEAVEARYRLQKVLARRKKTKDADALVAWMRAAAASSPAVREQLAALGWKDAS